MTSKKRTFTKAIPYSLTAIAAIAISWYTLVSIGTIGSLFSLLFIVMFTGLLTGIIPVTAKRFKPLYSVISTGLTILAIIIVSKFVSSFWITLLCIAIFGILTDLIVSRNLSFADILLDLIFCLLAAICLKVVPAVWSTIVILVAHLLLLCIQFKPELFKKNSTSSQE